MTWKGDIFDLIGYSVITVTRIEAMAMITASELTVGKLYYISDLKIWLRANAVNSFDQNGTILYSGAVNPYGFFELTGTSGTISELKVDNENILSAPIAFTTSIEHTLDLVAANINLHTQINQLKFKAVRINTFLVLEYLLTEDDITIPTGFITMTLTGDLADINIQNLDNGVIWNDYYFDCTFMDFEDIGQGISGLTKINNIEIDVMQQIYLANNVLDGSFEWSKIPILKLRYHNKTISAYFENLFIPIIELSKLKPATSKITKFETIVGENQIPIIKNILFYGDNSLNSFVLKGKSTISNIVCLDHANIETLELLYNSEFSNVTIRDTSYIKCVSLQNAKFKCVDMTSSSVNYSRFENNDFGGLTETTKLVLSSANYVNQNFIDKNGTGETTIAITNTLPLISYSAPMPENATIYEAALMVDGVITNDLVITVATEIGGQIVVPKTIQLTDIMQGETRGVLLFQCSALTTLNERLKITLSQIAGASAGTFTGVISVIYKIQISKYALPS